MSETGREFYIDSLDGIRAVAVLVVFMAHAGFGDIVPGGFGVTVFFFLSGYLITTLLRMEYEKNGVIYLRDFYIRRAYRIFPPFYLALIVGIMLVFLRGEPIDFDLFSVEAQAMNLTNYYQILFGYNVVPDTSLMWSLSVEEHYYLIYPLLLLFLLRRLSYPKVVLFLLVGCLMVLAWRYYLVLHVGVPAYHTNMATDTRIDSIFYGCILGLWMNPVMNDTPNCSTFWHLFVLCVSIGVLLLTFIYRDPVFRETLRYSLQGLALLPLFYLAIACSDWPLFRMLNWKWVRALGAISYSFYLFHMMALHVAFNWVHEHGVGNRWLAIPSGFFITLLISIAMYYCVEKPLIQRRKQLEHTVGSVLDRKNIKIDTVDRKRHGSVA